MAAANRGILYVDEVNLLNDHLVDVLLDAAGMGMNYVEREGISLSHPAQFILVGTMNPEEGDLRPQLLDRFALAVEIHGLADQPSRAEVVRRRIEYEAEPAAFAARWEAAQDAERDRIEAARTLLPEVVVDDQMLNLITHLCADFGVDGLRGDIVMYKTAATLAAYAGRTRVTEENVRDAAELALLHRRRRQPFEQPGLDSEDLDRAIQNHREHELPSGGTANPPPSEHNDSESAPDEKPAQQTDDQLFAASDPYAVRTLAPPRTRDQKPRRSGRRGRSRSGSGTGQYVAAARPEEGAGTADIAFDATVRAAAPHQTARRMSDPVGPAVLVRAGDLRMKVRESRAGNLILFAVDASGSMAARQRMTAAKQAVLSLLLDAYQKRDTVGLIAFRGTSAELLLAPTTSIELAERRLQTLPTGGRTPLAHALQMGLQTFQRHGASHPGDVPLLLVVSDGRANVALSGSDPVVEAWQIAARLRVRGVKGIVVDTEGGHMRTGLCRALSDALGGRYLPIGELRAGDLVAAVQDSVGRA